jgi:hypothetical protein
MQAGKGGVRRGGVRDGRRWYRGSQVGRIADDVVACYAILCLRLGWSVGGVNESTALVVAPVPTTLTIDLRRDRGGINDQFLFGPAGLANAAMDTFFVMPLMRHLAGTKAAEVWFAQALVHRGAVRSIVRGPWRFTDLIRTPPPEQAAYYNQPVIPACCPWLHARQHFEWRQLPNGTLCQC